MSELVLPEISPAALAAAWKAFRGHPTNKVLYGVMMGPGPAFKEALQAGLMVIEAEKLGVK